jgi:signal transduction histidine kinase
MIKQVQKETRVRLLLVEDDDVDREAVLRLLGPGYDVHNAATGTEALHLIDATTPDVVLLDFRLPDMEGLRIVPVCVERFLPVILLTGEDSPEVIVDAMQLGAQDYLVKGHIGSLALTRAIDNAIEKVAMKHDLAQHQIQLAEQADALEKSNRQVRALASALTLAEQRERRRISQILHDHVQQMLYGVQMRTYLIALDTPPELMPQLSDHLSEMETLVEEAIQATRSLTVDLSPPILQTEGIGAALQWLANQMHRLHDLQVDLHLHQEYRLASEDLRVLIFQLVRELLFNVAKHAGVLHAEVTVCDRDGLFLIHVEDKGCGFDPSKLVLLGENDGGFGLYSVRERLALFGGTVTINSRAGEGTSVVLALPQPVVET